ncbi:ATP-dependent protease La Type I, partial [hydrothermal vent metagenome]
MKNDKNPEQNSGDSPEVLNVPEILPILPLQGFVFFPGMGFPLQIGHKESKKLIDEALVTDHLVALIAHRPTKSGKTTSPKPEDHLFNIGSVGYIHKMSKGKEDVYNVLISSVKKIKILEYTQNAPYHKGR